MKVSLTLNLDLTTTENENVEEIKRSIDFLADLLEELLEVDVADEHPVYDENKEATIYQIIRFFRDRGEGMVFSASQLYDSLMPDYTRPEFCAIVKEMHSTGILKIAEFINDPADVTRTIQLFALK